MKPKKHLSATALLLSILASLPLQAAPTGLTDKGWLQPVVAGAGQDFAFARLENGVQLRVAGVVKNVLFYGPRTVRVNANLGESHWRHPSIVVLGKPAAVRFTVKEDARSLTIDSPELRIVADKKTGALAFHDATGRLYTREREDKPLSIKKPEGTLTPTYEVENTFTLKPDEAIYGFGYGGGPDTANRRGKNLLLIQTNIGITIPVMVSTESYGILWDTYSVMRFNDNAQGATLWAENAPGGVDYYFMGGQNMDDVVAAYRGLTGDAPMYPKQAFGLFMSKERYPTQERIVEVARAFRKEQFPLDYIVQDWQYWGGDKDDTWSGMTWDAKRFPEPERMIREIHGLDMKLMISIWPSVGLGSPLGKELAENNLFVGPLHWISKKARIYDAFSPKGREIYFKHVKAGLLDKGVDALWMDGTEVEFTGACHNPWDVARDIKSIGLLSMGDAASYLNPYTLMTTQGTYDGQRATGDKRVLTLTRSAWAGAQRTAAASWSGDTRASWQTLRQQINQGVNVTVTGNPYFTHDIGGFFVPGFPGGERNPAYRELFARWFQLGAFTPLMRVHGTNIEREPYIFKQLDPAMYDSLLKTVHLRYRLLPYIYGLAWQVTANDYTMMRPIPMDFPADKAAHNIDDAFLFGPSFLVHPVTRPMYNVTTTPPPSVIPSDALRTADGQPGLAVQYYAGTAFNTPKGKDLDQTVDQNWPGPPLAGPPGGLDGFDNFSARWEGFLVAPETGEYELGVEGDDGFRLVLDGKTVIEDWKTGGKRLRTTKLELTKGRRLPLELEYFQGTRDRNLRLVWRTPTDIRRLAEKSLVDTTTETYLPAGANWYDFWTNEPHRGGRTVKTDSPLDRFPLFVRAGSIVPMGPVMQYATEKPDAPYEIRVYPGADGAFTLYEDDNETYAYEKGQRATVELRWDNQARTLSIGPRQGSFPGMVAEREFRVVLVSQTVGAGLAEAPATRTVRYRGQAGQLKF